MEYYVYAYCDNITPEIHGGYQFSGRPFYIGYGKGNRFLFHLKEATKTLANKSQRIYNPHKVRKICKMLSTGIQPSIVILKFGLSKEEAKAEEVRLIAAIPNLTNIAKGGEGGDTLSSHPRAGNWGSTFDHRGNKNPMYGRHGADNPKSKLYTFTHESGDVFNVIGGKQLNDFISDQHLGRTQIFNLIKGRIPSHRGFTVEISKP